MTELSPERTERLSKTLDHLISAISTDTLVYLTNEDLDAHAMWYLIGTLFGESPSDHPRSNLNTGSPVGFFVHYYGERLTDAYDTLVQLQSKLKPSSTKIDSLPYLTIKRGNQLTCTLHKTNGETVTTQFNNSDISTRLLERLIKDIHQPVPVKELTQAIGVDSVNKEADFAIKQVRNAISTLRKGFLVRNNSSDDFISSDKNSYRLTCPLLTE